MIAYLQSLLDLASAKMHNPDASRFERGASAVEYGLLIAGIAAVIVAVVIAFGGKIHAIFENTCSSISSATAATTSGNCTS